MDTEYLIISAVSIVDKFYRNWSTFIANIFTSHKVSENVQNYQNHILKE